MTQPVTSSVLTLEHAWRILMRTMSVTYWKQHDAGHKSQRQLHTLMRGR